MDLGLALIMLGSFISGPVYGTVANAFPTVQTLKGKIVKSSGGALLRKSVVVIQFSISVALIISTILVFDQLKFVQDKNQGTNSIKCYSYYLPK